MEILKELTAGYEQFLKQTDPKTQQDYQVLAQEGQSPKVMVIGCCDSRVSPSLIFNEAPGRVFTVRNVANLVPPFEKDEAHHGTSAAIEFAVTKLQVENIVVMGHSHCGGIAASLQDVLSDGAGESYFIHSWVSIIQSVAAGVAAANPDMAEADLLPLVEKAAIKKSLANLREFPFVAEAMERGTLELHGLYFDIGHAALYALDQDKDAFVKLGSMEEE